MSLRNQTMWVLATVFTVFVLTAYVILNNILYTAFDRLETETATANLERVEQLLDADLKYIETITGDWAYWTDTYDFVNGRNDAYVSNNLADSYVATLNLSTMLFFNRSGQLVWGEFYDLANENQLIPLEQIFPQGFTADHPLLAHHSNDSKLSGVISTLQGPMLVSSRPVLTSDYQGPIAGTLVAGQLLDAAKIASLQERAQTPVQLWPVTSEAPTPAYPSGAEQLLAGGTHVVRVNSDNTLSLLSLRRGINDQPMLLLQVDTPRAITALGEQTINLALLFLLAAGVVVMAVIWALLRGLMLQPLASLTQHILDISRSGDLAKAFSVNRRDEIGILATEFTDMQARLAQTQRELLNQSYKAGVAENAAGVLHNVRNALTPLTSRISRLADELQNPVGIHVPKAFVELKDPESDPQRRGKLLDYVQTSWEKEVVERRAALRDGLQQAGNQLSHIADVITEQEKFTNSEPVLETLTVDKLIDEATALLPDLSARQVSLRIDPSVSDIGVLTTHRISIVQVLNNLLVNALESLSRAGCEGGTIVLNADKIAQDGQAMIRLRVADNGAGIAPEQLDTIFKRGFTSKSKGKGGMGLHWCANTVNALGGKLVAASDGINRGAEFQLCLPIR